MFCPNCGSQNKVGLNYCRSCGLNLEGVVQAVAEQQPSDMDPEYLRRKQKFERTGRGYLIAAGVAALVLVALLAALYTTLGYYFGAVLFGAIAAWFTFFVAPAIGFYSYPKYFLEPKYRPREESVPQAELPDSPAVTSRLIEDRPFESVPASVTEDTTEHLTVPRTHER